MREAWGMKRCCWQPPQQLSFPRPLNGFLPHHPSLGIFGITTWYSMKDSMRNKSGMLLTYRKKYWPFTLTPRFQRYSLAKDNNIYPQVASLTRRLRSAGIPVSLMANFQGRNMTLGLGRGKPNTQWEPLHSLEHNLTIFFLFSNEFIDSSPTTGLAGNLYPSWGPIWPYPTPPHNVVIVQGLNDLCSAKGWSCFFSNPRKQWRLGDSSLLFPLLRAAI